MSKNGLRPTGPPGHGCPWKNAMDKGILARWQTAGTNVFVVYKVFNVSNCIFAFIHLRENVFASKKDKI
jgi:UDP-N-acetylglucosamine pyrophosphorylase